jgi:toxin ParE1/3/4
VERRVAFSPEAASDLFNLYDYIASQSGQARAIGYTGRLESYCRGLRYSGERGTRRDDIRSGLRITGFERRVTIAFHVEATTVIIDRILYGGRDLRRAFKGRRPRRIARAADKTKRVRRKRSDAAEG